MWAAMKAMLILSAALLVVPHVCAGNAEPLDALPLTQQNLTPPNPARRPLANLDQRSDSLAISKAAAPNRRAALYTDLETILSNSAASNTMNNSKPAKLLDNVPDTRLHWAVNNQRPALEYRFSNQGTIRLQVSRRKTSATLAWKF